MTETQRRAANPRIAWFETLGAQTERDRPAPDVALPPPDEVRAERGRGQVTIRWTPVEGAAGYLVCRADRGGELVPIDHGGGDVLAVPHGPYVDTTGDLDAATAYAVASLATIDAPVGEASSPAAPVPLPRKELGRVAIRVDAAADVGRSPGRGDRASARSTWRSCSTGRGRATCRSATTSWRRSGSSGPSSARRWFAPTASFMTGSASTARRTAGPCYDFSRIDAALDRLLETGLRPIIELSFTPADLASDPNRTVFDYRGIISPPRDLGRWRDLVEALVRHLVDRHGRDEVARWLFEVWNEPNLQVFWTGTEGDYFDLYDASAEAVKAVDPAFEVGGPVHLGRGLGRRPAGTRPATGRPDRLRVDPHVRGSPAGSAPDPGPGRPARPADLVDRMGREPASWRAVNDSVWGAPLVARGMRSAAGRLHSLSYWVASDQFVELGAPQRLFHGGFGLLTVGNLRKPRFWAIWILEQLGTREVACELEGDGAGSLVEAWASRDDDRIAVASGTGRSTRARRTATRPGPRRHALDRRPGARDVPASSPAPRRGPFEHLRVVAGVR